MTNAIGWALIHSLWEGAAIALLLALVLAILRSARPQARYVAACAALVLMLLAPAYTYVRISSDSAATTDLAAPRPMPGNRMAATPPVPLVDRLLPWITLVWLAGVAGLSLRWTVAWSLLRVRMRRNRAGVPEEVRAVVEKLRAQLGIAREIALQPAEWLSSPAVTGWLRPTLLLPACAITGLTPDQLAAVLAHELAHIRRHDYLVNLIATTIETLLFYHPAVWWVSREIRIERENCCDDVAVSVCGDRLVYAEALTELAENRSRAVPELALAASGGALKKRIQRILYGRQSRGSSWPVSALVMALVMIGLWGGQRMIAQSPNLPAPYVKWLNEDVVYIITPEERAAFTRLATKEEAEHFIEQFWARRNPNPSNPAVNDARDEHYRRIAYSVAKFSNGATPGWKTDRGRTYIQYGPPDELESHPVDDYSAWRYRLIDGIGQNVTFTFFRQKLSLTNKEVECVGMGEMHSGNFRATCHSPN